MTVPNTSTPQHPNTATEGRLGMPIEVRAARPEEMSEVLDMVPRVMGATREYFAAAYRNDPWARPEHSRIVRVDGEIVSHIRLYDRWQRVGPIPVHVGCVGDVGT